MITQADTQRVKEGVNIVDVIDQFVSLKKQGKNYFGFCPFHDERTASFSVTAEKQLFKCFSCGRSGDVFSFFMEKDGLSFQEAVVKVAEIGHIEIDASFQTFEKRQLSEEEKRTIRLINMHELAAEFYHHILLNTVEGEEALAYVLSRGLSKDTIVQFKIGATITNRQVLYDLLKKHDYTDDELQQSGLFVKKQDDYFDRFYNRIMVPLRNEKGQVVAFSGRVYPLKNNESNQEQPKYLNSPETDLFHKGTFLFNLDQARGPIRKNGEVMLCEGYMDVIAVHQAGLLNAVASMGTSLTDNQIYRLKKITQQVLLAYDGDSAGMMATHRAIELFKKDGQFNLSIVPMPDNLDPDELIQQKGVDYFKNHVLHDKESVFEFYKRYYKKQFKLDSQKELLDYVDVLLKELTHETSLTARDLHIKALSDEFSISIKALQEQFNVFLNETGKQRKVQSNIKQQYLTFVNETNTKRKSEKEQVEWLILQRLLTQEATVLLLFQNCSDFHFDNELYQKMLLLYMGYRQERGNSLHRFSDTLTDAQLKQLYADSQLGALETEITQQEMLDLLARLKQCRLKEERQVLKMALAQARKENNTQKIDDILLKLITLK